MGFKSYLKRCTFCKQVGHMEQKCPERRRQAAARHAEWVARQKKIGADDFDAKSTISASSISTAATKTPATFVLSEPETKEARKYAKMLREIAAIEDDVSRGEKVDKKQLEKVQRRAEMEETLVMKKVRAGYSYFSA